MASPDSHSSHARHALTSTLRRAWDSPTLTAWGAKLTQFLRMFLLLPLILRHFDDTQVAAWFLFGSLTFFATTIGDQVALLFSRMIAMATGGAEDLSPVKGKVTARADTQPNWPLIGRVYSTIQSLNVVTASVGTLVVAALGFFSLEAVVRDYDRAVEVWTAFGIVLVALFINQALMRYAIGLRGLNKVALSNRVAILFSLASILGGVPVLLTGGGIVELVFVVEVLMLLSIPLNWALLHFVCAPRFRGFALFAWDKQVLLWLWQPLWRTLIQTMANRGSVRVTTVFLARAVDVQTLSAILLTLRVLEFISSFARAPIASHGPRFSRLLGQGNIPAFRNGITRAFRLAMAIMVALVVLCGFTLPIFLKLLGSEVQALPLLVYFCIALPFVLTSSIQQTLSISLIGNHVVAVNRLVAAFPVSLALAIGLIPLYPVFGFVVASFLPMILIVNRKPLQIGCALLETPPFHFYRKTFLLPHAVLLITTITVVLVTGTGQTPA